MFNALVVNKDDEGKTSAAVAQLSLDDLPAGEVTVAVEYSTVNYTFLSGLDNDASGIANGEPAKATGTGVINFGGDLGQPNQYYYNSTSQHQGGHGGGSGAGSGGRNGIAKGDIHGPTDAVGNDGAGGGSSPNCSTTDRSGAGADGYVMIEEFYTQ